MREFHAQIPQIFNVWCGILRDHTVDENSNGKTHLQIIREDASPEIADINFPGRWISRRGLMMEWPPRSLDLAPLVFFYGDISTPRYMQLNQKL
nr:unnamed protein product [Callosobruchus chinensis]